VVGGTPCEEVTATHDVSGATYRLHAWVVRGTDLDLAVEFELPPGIPQPIDKLCKELAASPT
jgi:hypothetical protein